MVRKNEMEIPERFYDTKLIDSGFSGITGITQTALEFSVYLLRSIIESAIILRTERNFVKFTEEIYRNFQSNL